VQAYLNSEDSKEFDLRFNSVILSASWRAVFSSARNDTGLIMYAHSFPVHPLPRQEKTNQDDHHCTRINAA